MRPVKICHLIAPRQLSDAHQPAAVLIRSLQQEGIPGLCAVVGTPGDQGKADVSGEIHVLAGKVVQPEGRPLAPSVRDLVDLIRKTNCTILHVHHPDVMKAAAWAALLTGRRCCVTRYDRKDHAVSGWIWRRYDAVIPVSRHLGEDLGRTRKVPSNKIQVIYPCVEPPANPLMKNGEWRAQIRTKLGLQRDTFLIANTGELVPSEDQATLLKAFRKLLSKKMKAELILADEGVMRPVLEQLAGQFNILDHVKFLSSAQCLSALDVADVMAVSSYEEGLHPAVIPAMARGIPVVATKVPGTREVIEDTRTGYLVPCGFPERMESAISRMYANPALRTKISEETLNYAQQCFAPEVAVAQYRKVYEL